jgi:hypothetical protein
MGIGYGLLAKIASKNRFAFRLIFTVCASALAAFIIAFPLMLIFSLFDFSDDFVMGTFYVIFLIMMVIFSIYSKKLADKKFRKR